MFLKNQSDMSLVGLSHRTGKTDAEILKNQQFTKTQRIEVIKIIGYYLNILFYYFNETLINTVKNKLILNN